MYDVADVLSSLECVGESHNLERSFDFFVVREFLVELQELEKEIGCPLDVMSRALKNGIYINNGLTRAYYIHCEYWPDEGGYYFRVDSHIFLLKDYKKTWWLASNKSE